MGKQKEDLTELVGRCLMKEELTIRNNLFEVNSNIFERKIRNVVRETNGISNETKAYILLKIQDELEGRNEYGEEI